MISILNFTAKFGRTLASLSLLTFGLAGCGGTSGGTAGGGGGGLPIAPANVITEYTIPTTSSVPYGLAEGPDGNLWFTENAGNKVGKVSITGSFAEYPAGSATPQGIAAGPDGNMWFNESQGNNVAKVTMSGAITEYPIPTAGAWPFSVVAGPDGNMVYRKRRQQDRQDHDGRHDHRVCGSDSRRALRGITVGPDGNLWFTEYDGNKIGKITTGGTITEYAIPTVNANARGIATGMTATCGLPNSGATRSENHDERDGHRISDSDNQQPAAWHLRARTATYGS